MPLTAPTLPCPEACAESALAYQERPDLVILSVLKHPTQCFIGPTVQDSFSACGPGCTRSRASYHASG